MAPRPIPPPGHEVHTFHLRTKVRIYRPMNRGVKEGKPNSLAPAPFAGPPPVCIDNCSPSIDCQVGARNLAPTRLINKNLAESRWHFCAAVFTGRSVNRASFAGSAGAHVERLARPLERRFVCAAFGPAPRARRDRPRTNWPMRRQKNLRAARIAIPRFPGGPVRDRHSRLARRSVWAVFPGVSQGFSPLGPQPTN